MTFINGMLAAGAAAFVVPLVIHLLYRHRAKKVAWGAMHLLTDVIRSNRRRLRWTDWILLAIRCGIPIMLALAMARPLIPGWQSATGEPRRIAIVIDQSASTSALKQAGETFLDRARRVAGDVVSNSRRGDEIIVIGSATLVELPSIGGARDAVAAIDALQPGGAAATLADMIAAGLKSIGDAPHGSVVVVSDATASVIDAIPANAYAATAEAIAAKPNIDVAVISVGNQLGDEPANVWIDPLLLDTPLPLADQVTPWVTTIHNQTDVPRPASVATVRTGGETQTIEVPAIEARSTRLIRWTTPARGVSETKMTVSIESPDAMAIDNVRDVTFQTRPPAPVAVITPRDDAAARYLTFTLAPFAASNQSSNVVRVVTDLPDAMTMIDDLAAVVITDDVAPTDDMRSRFNEFVHAGGQLIVMAGQESVDPWWQTHANELSLPAVPGGTIATGTDTPITTTIVAGSPWSTLQLDSGIEMQVERVRDLKIDNATESEVWWRTPSGTPLAIARRVGAGRVVQISLPPTPSWSQWPIRTAFLPMMQTLVFARAAEKSVTRENEIPAIESQLRPAGQAAVAAATERLGATFVDDADSLAARENLSRDGREMWRWLIAGLLLLMIAELLWQQRARPPQLAAVGVYQPTATPT